MFLCTLLGSINCIVWTVIYQFEIVKNLIMLQKVLSEIFKGLEV